MLSDKITRDKISPFKFYDAVVTTRLHFWYYSHNTQSLHSQRSLFLVSDRFRKRRAANQQLARNEGARKTAHFHE